MVRMVCGVLAAVLALIVHSDADAVEYRERDWSSARLPSDLAREADLPDWARIGELLFTRMDGGQIEVRKASKTNWGIMFSPEEYDILSKVYTDHSDRIVEAMAEAGINACWVTWSNGHSWTTEAEQRADLTKFIKKCNAKNIHVMAYVCQSTIFWEDVFLHEPKAVNWFIKNPDGTPYQLYYRNPHRYAADVSNPQWQAYQKRRIAAATEAGCEAFFFDNVVADRFSRWELEAYYRELKRYIRDDLGRSDVLISMNPHLQPAKQYLHDFCEMIFSESGSEPGVWEDTGWEISNVRKMRYLKGNHPPWKPIYYQHGALHSKTRETRALPPKSEALSIAEGAMLGATYTRLWEGTPLQGLVDKTPEVMATYEVIRRYNRFLRENKEFYLNAHSGATVCVLVPSHDWPIIWNWRSESHTAARFIDRLSMKSFPYEVRTSDRVSAADLAGFKLMLLIDWPEPESDELELIRKFKAGGGRVLTVGGPNQLKDMADEYLGAVDAGWVAAGDAEVWAKFTAAYANLGGSFPVEISGSEYCTGNLTILPDSKTAVLHLLNYSPEPARGLDIRVDLKGLISGVKKSGVTLFSPDGKSKEPDGLVLSGSVAKFKLPELETYAVVAFNK